jgi:hypothetical protein
MRRTFLNKTIACAGALFLMAAATTQAATFTRPSASQGRYSSYVYLSWSANSSAVYGYDVLRTPTAEFRNAVTLGKTTNRYWIDRTAQAGRLYWYWIAPRNSRRYLYSYYSGGYRWNVYQYYHVVPYTGTSAYSSQKGYRTVSVPIPSVGKGTSQAGIYLSWGSSAQSWYGYQIRRGTSTDRTKAVVIANTSKSQRSYLDTTAYPGRKYYYWIYVRGYNTVFYNSASSTPYGYGYRGLSVPQTQGYETSDGELYLYFNAASSSVTGAKKYRVYCGTATSIGTWVDSLANPELHWIRLSRSMVYPRRNRRTYWRILPVDERGVAWQRTDKSGYLSVVLW